MVSLNVHCSVRRYSTADDQTKALAKETAVAFQSLHERLEQLQSQTTSYPFLSNLSGPLGRLDGMMGQPYAFYLTDLRQHEDELFDLKEAVTDPIQRFMNGPQKDIYDRARRFVETQEANLSYLDGDEARRLRAILDDPSCYRGDALQQAKRLLDALQAAADALIGREKERLVAKVEHRWQRLADTGEYAALTPEQQAALRQPFDALGRQIEHQTLIAVMRDTLRRFDERDYDQCLRQMTAWAAPEPGAEDGKPDAGNACQETRVEYVTRSALAVDFDQLWLADEADVERYLAALKEALLEAINDKKRVRI